MRATYRAACHSFACCALLGTLFSTRLAAAEGAAPPTREACFASHAKSQELRLDGKLLEARSELRVCAASACPGVLQGECSDWLAQVQQAIPSVVILAENERGDVSDVRVSIDGQLVASQLEGGVFELNPGAHRFTFELEGYPKVEQNIVLRQDEKRRAVRVVFQQPRPDEPTTPTVPGPAEPTPGREQPAPLTGPRPIPVATWVFGGLALAAAGTSAYFGVTGLSDYSEKEDSCAPNCTSNDSDDVKRNLLIADVAGGAAIASAGLAAYFYFTRPVVPEQGSSWAEGVRVSAGAGGLSLGYSGAF